MRSVRVAVAVALLGASVSAGAYVREKTSDEKNPLPLFWRNRCVTYAVNKLGTRVDSGCGGVPGDTIDAVNQAFSAWPAAAQSGQVCTNFRFAYLGQTVRTDTGYDQTSSHNVNLVIWRQGICAQSASDPCHAKNTCGNANNCWDHSSNGETIALTTTTYVVSTGEILDADMEYFGWDGTAASASDSRKGWYFTCTGASNLCSSYGDANCSYVDVQNTVTHEAGHIVGLDHSPDFSATMYWSANPGELTKRVLGTDDVSGICAIYPVGGPQGICNMDYSLLDPPPSKGSTCGFGTGAGGLAGVLASLLAGLAVRRRRNRQRAV